MDTERQLAIVARNPWLLRFSPPDVGDILIAEGLARPWEGKAPALVQLRLQWLVCASS
jgi:hypothetical protein